MINWEKLGKFPEKNIRVPPYDFFRIFPIRVGRMIDGGRLTPPLCMYVLFSGLQLGTVKVDPPPVRKKCPDIDFEF